MNLPRTLAIGCMYGLLVLVVGVSCNNAVETAPYTLDVQAKVAKGVHATLEFYSYWGIGGANNRSAAVDPAGNV